VRLSPEPTTLLEFRPDEPLAIGSTFKLYVLAALTQHPSPWTTVIRLRSEWKSLPSGVLHSWPDGSPVTVHTLAVQMISVSDNTAADHLVHWLGRGKIEDALAQFGHSSPDRTKPFLTTREMFVLKSHPELLRRYVEADIQQRRALLEREVARAELDRYTVPPEPIAVAQVEWFASCRDLCRLMDYFRRRSDPVVLAILAVNPGLPGLENRFAYVGYKGGSEAGVVNMTWLVQDKRQRWYAISMSWNNEKSDVDIVQFAGLGQAALELVAQDESGSARVRKQ